MCARAFKPSPALTSVTVEEAQHIISDTAEPSPLVKAAKVMWDDREQYRKAIELVGGIMSAKCDMNNECDSSFRDFERLLKNDYQEFARQDNYPAEAEAYRQLRDIFLRMSRIRLAPRLASRNVCAVAGGFSSGKSSFLNSMIGDNDVLPTAITPTTSLPTYILHVDDSMLTIEVFNHDGGKKQVDKKTLSEMTHDFDRKYHIQLRTFLDRVAVYTPNLSDWKRIALIDTPGYTNPDGSRHIKGDRQVALEQILGCRFLIWLVDCEKGTLPQEDISFIRKFLEKSSSIGNVENRPIYIILNKADKKPQGRKKILDQVRSASRNNSIPYFGIGLYSAREGKWYVPQHERAFRQFLAMVNRAPVTIGFDREVGSVFDKYVQHHENECEEFKRIHGLMQRIEIRLGEEGDIGRELGPNLPRSIQKKGRAIAKDAEAIIKSAKRFRKKHGRDLKLSNPGSVLRTIVDKARVIAESGAAFADDLRPKADNEPVGDETEGNGKLYRDLDEQKRRVKERAKDHEKRAEDAHSLKGKFDRCTRDFMKSCGLHTGEKDDAGCIVEGAIRTATLRKMAMAARLREFGSRQ